ncbi:MAG: cation diffusion facilitator family transporter [Lachnospiraceae bacterium]|jgi:cation diffusion facilitator family transporter
MSKRLLSRFIKDYENTGDNVVRARYAAFAGVFGMVSNFFLFLIKIIAGTIFGSIAVTADAVNNLTDAGSSIIVLVGFKLSSKPPDEKHPYGHARAEYITSFLVSVVILLLGLELIKASFQKILNPDPIHFSYLTVAALIISILVKLWQRNIYKTFGKRINSTALIATSQDSLNDVLSTSAVLVATVFAELTKIQIDGYMGIAVALFIMYSGVRLAIETLNPLLGTPPDKKLVSGIEKEILSYDGVLGIHDLIVHSYGPNNIFVSVHVEVDAGGDLLESHDLIDNIEKDITEKFNVKTVIHMDPIVTDDERTNELRKKVEEIIRTIDTEMSMHDFRVAWGNTHSNLIFDVLLPISYDGSETELKEKIDGEIKKIDPAFYSVITIDRSYTSSAIS